MKGLQTESEQRPWPSVDALFPSRLGSAFKGEL